MYCPACSSPILATDARCINCNKLLIESSEKKSEEFKKAAEFVDNKIYYGVGAFIGFLITLAFFYPDQELMTKASPIGAVVGGLIGRYFAKQQWK
ncbi:hypothetical protein C3Y98_00960 [Methylotenera oryzisoli]|jgi:hypothetical protein|uniref:Uncharacterized protein n=1 Tax=Methylotenera oryzisoli TaxID=2080758 RepID=A0A4Y9VTR9_9PROT|nr:hypothetical protein [Methylotenera oryzisoli]TFW72961.1 hypothetical protein C3Y98_00960 [Methylotenera oryzisoli]